MSTKTNGHIHQLQNSKNDFDILLRCPVCKDYFNSPVILSTCSHSFCSECIRRSLLYKSECPVCRQQGLRSQLIPNIIINQILNIYKLKQNNNLNLNKIKYKKNKSIQCNIIPSNNNNNNHKMFSINSQNKNNNYNNNSNRIKSNNIKSFMNPINKRNPKKRKLNDINMDNTSYGPPKTRRKLNNKSNTVSCPVCAKLVQKSFINSHVDKCLIVSTKYGNKSGSGCDDSDCDIDIKEKDKEDLRTKSNCLIKLLPFPAYSQLNEKDLKKLLQKLSLNNNGNKKILIKRHREYIIRHNSQIDSYLNGNNNVLNDRNITKQMNNEENVKIHSNFFSKSNNQKKNNKKRKNKQDLLFKKLIKDLKKRMGKEWVKKIKKLKKKRRKIRKKQQKQLQQIK